MCDFNFILQHLKKKKIDGNVFAAEEPSAGIKGSGERRERTPNPHSCCPTMHQDSHEQQCSCQTHPSPLLMMMGGGEGRRIGEEVREGEERQ